jgi:cytochrome c oxidase cbb3-type subunit III
VKVGWAAAGTVALIAVLLGCEREQRRFSEIAPASGPPGSAVESSGALPGGNPPVEVANPYGENAWALSEGQRLYTWFNCNGCHSMGGGGMGPALMDEIWRYGSDPHTIFVSIADGRPNGMPAFGSRIPAQQIWQLVTYVRSLSSLVRKDLRPSRADSLSGRPPPSLVPPAKPLIVPPEPPR